MPTQEPPFSVDQAAQEGRAVVRVTGGVDMSTVAAFERALERAFAESDGDVGLDLTGVTFFGSEGVRALLAAQDGPGAAGRTVRIVGASPIAQRVLQITGLA